VDAAFEDELHLRRVEDVVRSARGLHLDKGVCLGTGVILVQVERVLGPLGRGQDFVVIRIVETEVVRHFSPADEPVESGEEGGRKVARRFLDLQQESQRRELTRREEGGKNGGGGGR